MNKKNCRMLLICSLLSGACSNIDVKKPVRPNEVNFRAGEFGYDLQFLKKQDSGLVVLTAGDAQLIVSPKYQAKVFTSTANGLNGMSFGWINYRAFSKTPDPHMNAFGGENRLWLGPEGGKFSLFFPPGSEMVFANWKTPSPIDTEGWEMRHKDSGSVTMIKEMTLMNYAGTKLHLRIDRTIRILGRQDIFRRTGIASQDSVKAIAYQTENELSNLGDQDWNDTTGMPCIWILDMFKPSPETSVFIPFQPDKHQAFDQMVTTNYFGEIPAARIKHTDSAVFFKTDGKSRGKLGIKSAYAKNMAGSYDAQNSVLTIIQFELNTEAPYLNQEWNKKKPPFSGDAVNAYNDGPLTDGSQMGPFYEIESVSPAAFLKKHEAIAHRHTVFHFTGSETELDKIALEIFGISLRNIKFSK